MLCSYSTSAMQRLTTWEHLSTRWLCCPTGYSQMSPFRPWSWGCNSCITSLAPTIAGWTHSPHLHPLTLYPFIVPFVACSHREGLHREHCRAQRSSAGEAEHRLQLGKPLSVEPHCSSSASTGHNDHCTSCLSLPDCCHEQLYTLNHRCGRQCIWPAVTQWWRGICYTAPHAMFTVVHGLLWS